jgi:serine/threonine protein kinase
LKIIDFGLARGMDFKDNPKMSTNYVQTRWYRAPELLLKADTVTPQVDVWSVGCIMAELYLRKPFFRGSSPIDQIKKIIDVLGTPGDLEMVGSLDGKDYVKKHFSGVQKKDFATLLPNISKEGIDMLKWLLVVSPLKRPSALEALKHPYFSPIFEKDNVVMCSKFDNSFEEELEDKNTEHVRDFMFKAMVKFKDHLKKKNCV